MDWKWKIKSPSINKGAITIIFSLLAKIFKFDQCVLSLVITPPKQVSGVWKNLSEKKRVLACHKLVELMTSGNTVSVPNLS